MQAIQVVVVHQLDIKFGKVNRRKLSIHAANRQSVRLTYVELVGRKVVQAVCSKEEQAAIRAVRPRIWPNDANVSTNARDCGVAVCVTGVALQQRDAVQATKHQGFFSEREHGLDWLTNFRQACRCSRHCAVRYVPVVWPVSYLNAVSVVVRHEPVVWERCVPRQHQTTHVPRNQTALWIVRIVCPAGYDWISSRAVIVA